MKKSLFMPIALMMLLAALLASCASNNLRSSFFRRNVDYTSAVDVAELMSLLQSYGPGEMTQEDAIDFANLWGAQKYLRSETAQNGYEEKPLLNVPVGQLGLLKISSYQVLLPPRNYSNIPTGDDEVQLIPALCVEPGFIAWRFNELGSREVAVGQGECYYRPLSGWTIEPTLRINTGELAWRVNLKGELEVKNEVGAYPQEFFSEWTVEQYLVVPEGTVAYRKMDNGEFEYRSPNPGVYPTEISSRWTKVEAVQVNGGEFGIFVQTSGSVIYLTPGVHYDALNEYVKTYPTSELRYRTLSISGLSNEEIAEILKPESPQCASAACGTVIDRVVIDGTQRLASLNIDAGFMFVDPSGNPDLLAKYKNLPEFVQAVQDYVEGPLRESVRSVCSDMNQADLESEAGKTECENRIMLSVQEHNDKKNSPIVLTYVNLRSRNFGDEALRVAAAEAEVQLQREQSRIAQAEAQRLALEAEASALNALRAQIQARMASVNQAVDVTDGVTCQELVLLNALNIIDLDWSKLPKEMCQSGSTTISVNAP